MTIFRLPRRMVSALAASLFFASSHTAIADEWEFALSPLFLWGVSIEGDATMAGQTLPLDLAFKDDVWENLEAALTFHFEARKNDWTILLEYQYLDLGPDADISVGPVTGKAGVDFASVTAELGLGWTFSETKTTRWELIGGARYFDHEVEVDINLSLPPPLPSQSRGVEGGDDWTQGFGGVRARHSFGNRWSLIGRADYAYGGTDNNAINASFMFDYRFKDWGSAVIGYRYMDIEYDNDKRGRDNYGYDAVQQGPVAGITLYW